MAENSTIEWCDHTFNPWEGCTKVSPGCANCYAETRNKRWNGGKNWGKGAPRRRTSPSNWKQPLKWNKNANICSLCGECYPEPVECICNGQHNATHRARVFCASLADWLDDEVPIEWVADLLALIHATPNLDWLLLTKRPENWKDRVQRASLEFWEKKDDDISGMLNVWTVCNEPPSNVWIGTTTEDQQRADERIPALLSIPARVRFLSVEPMLGYVRLPLIHWCKQCDRSGFKGSTAESCQACCGSGIESVEDGISWVICGGESGHGARPMQIEWAESLAKQCRAADVAFFMKQLGGSKDKRHDIDQFPTSLRIRQFPAVPPTSSAPGSKL